MLIRADVPTEVPLPWDDRPNHTHRQSIAGWRLDPSAVVRFDELLHEIHPEARHVDVDRIASLGRWLHGLPASRARMVLDDCVTRIELLRTMVNDADWDQREAPCSRMHKLLVYMDQDADLIPDNIPLLGLLDDVILLELAWPAVATEVEDYMDFIEFRNSEHPSGDAAQQREAWIAARLEALALFQQKKRVNDTHYVESGKPEGTFRVR